MLSILGAGYCYPENVIDNEFLTDIGLGEAARALERSTGIKSRRTVLTLDYIKTTKNLDLTAAVNHVSETATDLVYKASLMALDRAGIKPEQISCIIGDCSTPFQSTPSEAQRLGAKFGFRLPAYDAAASAGSIPLHLDLLANFKEDKVPEYCLCIATNTPTCRVTYDKGSIALCFGDAAAALVVSAKHTGKIAVRDTCFDNEVSLAGRFGFGSFDPVNISENFISGPIFDYTNKMLEVALKKAAVSRDSVKFIGTQADSCLLEKIAKLQGISSSSNLKHVDWSGYTLSSGIPAVLAENWERLKPNDSIICAYAGPGLSYGYTTLGVL